MTDNEETLIYKYQKKLNSNQLELNEIKPQVTVPIHYGSIVGTNQDATDFSKLLHPQIECKILIK